MRAAIVTRRIEALAAATGLAGAALLASNGTWAAHGWIWFLASNAGWLAYARRTGAWFLFAQQIGFTCTSLLGLWMWTLRPLARLKGWI